jgi:hypothetical protein
MPYHARLYASIHHGTARTTPHKYADRSKHEKDKEYAVKKMKTMGNTGKLLHPSLSRRWQRRMQHQWRRAAADLTASPFFFARERELQVARTGRRFCRWGKASGRPPSSGHTHAPTPTHWHRHRHRHCHVIGTSAVVVRVRGEFLIMAAGGDRKRNGGGP